MKIALPVQAMPQAQAQAQAVPSPTPEASTRRQRYVDVFRGLLIAHMALDHASLMFNTGRPGEELAAAAAPVYGDPMQFLTRFYVLGLAAAIVRSRFGLGETYLIWLLLLAAMAGPCAWYYRKKRDRPNLVTRYF